MKEDEEDERECTQGDGEREKGSEGGGE